MAALCLGGDFYYCSDDAIVTSYSDFNLQTQDGSFLSSVLPISPSPCVKEFLKQSFPLAVAIGAEKARAELLVSPLLLVVRETFDLKEYAMLPVEQIWGILVHIASSKD